ncbi:hypothetical protein A0J61_01394 [Choanephora cucurbitarum]|uniref:Uncharacterized protein n=1 Tax=Choanephora cucurbitarum TaxID=101091 RepID=A0A1C7NN37_9FUNG|nr:hypothetical protein A0J61_01394 [Choanephora cucurbitarum]
MTLDPSTQECWLLLITAVWNSLMWREKEEKNIENDELSRTKLIINYNEKQENTGLEAQVILC